MKRLYFYQRRQRAELGMRRNLSQLDLFEWKPRSREDVRAAVLAAFATATASAVAARVGVSRASVLGIAKRARDAGRPVELVRPTSARAQRQATATVTTRRPPDPPVPPLCIRTPTIGTPMPVVRRDPAPLFVVELHDMPSLMTLSERQCRAIIDETNDCCGLPTEGRSSWCRAHRAAYRAAARPLRLREDLL